jgi:putative hemolysin
MPLDEVAELLGLPEPADEEREDIQTLGGLVMAQLGRVPAPGDHVAWRGVRLEVLDMDGRRVDKVLITPPALTGA